MNGRPGQNGGYSRNKTDRDVGLAGFARSPKTPAFRPESGFIMSYYEAKPNSNAN